MSTLKLSFTNTYEHAVLTLKKGNKCNIRKMKHNALALKAGLNESGPMIVFLIDLNESYRTAAKLLYDGSCNYDESQWRHWTDYNIMEDTMCDEIL